MDKKESLKIINNFVNKLCKDFTVNQIIFFGNRASEKPRKDSDIDLIIVSDYFKEMVFLKGFQKCMIIGMNLFLLILFVIL